MNLAEYLLLEARVNSKRGMPSPSVELESDLHEDIIKFCREQPKPWVCLHSRMDRRPTNNLGTPDFIIVTHDGRVFFVEAKRRLGKCSPAQNALLAWLTKNGAKAGIVRSMQEFEELVK